MVFSVRISLRPEGYYLMYCVSEKRSSLKAGDFSQKPKVSFWHSLIISSELFCGRISSLAKNLLKLAEARHFSKKWISLSA